MSATLMTREAEELREQRDMLLEALRDVVAYLAPRLEESPTSHGAINILPMARRVIAKVEAAS